MPWARCTTSKSCLTGPRNRSRCAVERPDEEVAGTTWRVSDRGEDRVGDGDRQRPPDRHDRVDRLRQQWVEADDAVEVARVDVAQRLQADVEVRVHDRVTPRPRQRLREVADGQRVELCERARRQQLGAKDDHHVGSEAVQRGQQHPGPAAGGQLEERGHDPRLRRFHHAGGEVRALSDERETQVWGHPPSIGPHAHRPPVPRAADRRQPRGGPRALARRTRRRRPAPGPHRRPPLCRAERPVGRRPRRGRGGRRGARRRRRGRAALARLRPPLLDRRVPDRAARRRLRARAPRHLGGRARAGRAGLRPAGRRAGRRSLGGRRVRPASPRGPRAARARRGRSRPVPSRGRASGRGSAACGGRRPLASRSRRVRRRRGARRPRRARAADGAGRHAAAAGRAAARRRRPAPARSGGRRRRRRARGDGLRCRARRAAGRGTGRRDRRRGQRRARRAG